MAVGVAAEAGTEAVVGMAVAGVAAEAGTEAVAGVAADGVGVVAWRLDLFRHQSIMRHRPHIIILRQSTIRTDPTTDPVAILLQPGIRTATPVTPVHPLPTRSRIHITALRSPAMEWPRLPPTTAVHPTSQSHAPDDPVNCRSIAPSVMAVGHLRRKRRGTEIDAAGDRTKVRYQGSKPVQRREVREIIRFRFLVRLALSAGVLTLSSCPMRVNDPNGPPPYVYSPVPGGNH